MAEYGVVLGVITSPSSPPSPLLSGAINESFEKAIEVVAVSSLTLVQKDHTS